MTEKKMLDLLQEAHREPVAPAHYAAVWARVLAEVQREREGRPVWRRVWLSGLAAVAALVLLLLFPKPVQTPEAPVLVGQAVLPAVPEAVVRPARGRRNRLPHHVRVPETRPTEPFVVKLLTDDPNVVIYWISDAKGD